MRSCVHGQPAISAHAHGPRTGPLSPPFFFIFFPHLHLDNHLGRPTSHPRVAQEFPVRFSLTFGNSVN
jgi:hypothetical protein